MGSPGAMSRLAATCALLLLLSAASSCEEHPRRLQSADPCAGKKCPHVGSCLSLGGVPVCSCPSEQFSRYINGTCSFKPIRHFGWLDAHNNARLAVGSAELQWSTKLAAKAQVWANILGLNGCSLRKGRVPVGANQNTANRFNDNKFKNFDAVNLWVRRGAQYTISPVQLNGAGGCSSGRFDDCAPYVQVIWNNTKLIGCAMARCPSLNGKVWVCNYSPKGNIQGQLPVNAPVSRI